MKEDIIIETLALRVEQLKKEVDSLKQDAKMSAISQGKMIPALNGVFFYDFFKEGNILCGNDGIYLLYLVVKDGEYGYASARLCTYLKDGKDELNFDIDFEGEHLAVHPENTRPASDHEIMMFDYLLKERGYKRNTDGTLFKI